MEPIQKFEKKNFIIQECMLFSVQAGLQTRNKNFPIYNKLPEAFTELRDIKYQPDNTSNLKLDIFDFLEYYLSEIKDHGIKEDIHIQRIEQLAAILTHKYRKVLFDGRFRIGVSQKIINLFLKYMWSMDEISEPCHCPIDGIIKSQIQKRQGRIKLVDWTMLDDINDYKDYISVVKLIAKDYKLSIAQWEFLNWGRR